MEILLALIFLVLISFNDAPICSAYNFNSRIEYFQVLKKHPKIGKCVNEVYGKNEFIGCRLHEETEKCEELPQSWGVNLTIVKGYSYAIKVSAKENYNPMHYSDENEFKTWRIPVKFYEGSKVTMAFSSPFDYIDKLIIYLSSAEVKNVGDLFKHEILNLNADTFPAIVMCDSYKNYYCKVSVIAESISYLTVSATKMKNHQEISTDKQEFINVPNLTDVTHVAVLYHLRKTSSKYLNVYSIEFSSKNVLP